jgi:hypothetical protein
MSALMYLSIKSRIVSQRAVNVESVKSGVKCCKNTLQSRFVVRIRVSSIPMGSHILIGSSSLDSSGNST